MKNTPIRICLNPQNSQKRSKNVFLWVYTRKNAFWHFFGPQRSEFCLKMAHFRLKYGIFAIWPVFVIQIDTFSSSKSFWPDDLKRLQNGQFLPIFDLKVVNFWPFPGRILLGPKFYGPRSDFWPVQGRFLTSKWSILPPQGRFLTLPRSIFDLKLVNFDPPKVHFWPAQGQFCRSRVDFWPSQGRFLAGPRSIFAFQR